MFANCRLVCALTVIALLANQAGQSKAQNDTVEREVTSRNVLTESISNNPNAFWLLDNGPILDGNQNLAEILRRVGPNMRASVDYHDYQDVQPADSAQAWQLMREQAKQYALDQVQFHRPKVMKLLRNANVSRACQLSAHAALQSMANLESWPVKMWSSTGSFPPVGIFDGQFTSLGSYRGCVDLNAPVSKLANKLESRQTSYCTLAFRPILPARPKFHMIFEEPAHLTGLFNRSDAFYSFASRAQFFHYIYMKTGVCVPAECTAIDMQQVAGVIGANLVLMPGPVKCFTRARVSLIEPSMKLDENEFGKIENKPVLVELGKPMNQKQMIAGTMVISFFLLVLIATVWHAAELSLSEPLEFETIEGGEASQNGNEFSLVRIPSSWRTKSTANNDNNQPIKRIAFHYLSMITNLQDFLDIPNRSDEIKCLHSIRVITMLWIILVHTFQYNEWSGFTRIFEIIATLQNPFLHPIYNANYSVDNFFFLSGLLAAYTTCRSCKNDSSLGFNLSVSLIGRYLRLTPQVLLISLLYMLLPLAGDGPFWYDTTHDASMNCENNWWINLLHLQAFYKTDEICNLVSWWISVDMFYYIVALGLMYMILRQHVKSAAFATMLIVGGCTSVSVYKHFTNGYPPNNLGTVPQVGEVWTNYVVNFFWSPYPHSFAFFLGLWVGWALANNKWRAQVRAWSRVGFTVSVISLTIVSLSSHIWMSGAVKLGSQYVSTVYNNVCPIVWSIALAWIVAACHYDCAPRLNKVLSINLFVLLSKASFIIYLSHMLLVRMYFGLQNTVLEVSFSSLSYTVIGNSFVSIIFGVFLCVSFEGPCMKFQKLVTQKLKLRRRNRKLSTVAGANHKPSTETDDNKLTDLGPIGHALLK